MKLTPKQAQAVNDIKKYGAVEIPPSCVQVFRTHMKLVEKGVLVIAGRCSTHVRFDVADAK